MIEAMCLHPAFSILHSIYDPSSGFATFFDDVGPSRCVIPAPLSKFAYNSLFTGSQSSVWLAGSREIAE
jgi:hypothetical protein